MTYETTKWLFFAVAIFLLSLLKECVKSFRAASRAESVKKLKMLIWAGFKGAIWVTVLAGVVFACVATYAFVDSLGWLTHRKDTTVFIQGNWWVGEHRTCFGDLERDGANKTLGCAALFRPPDGNSWSSFPAHILPVVYHGRVDRDIILLQWNCQRKEASLVCDAIN